MYFLRLAKIKPAVEKVASAAWDELEIGGERVKKVDRVLDVRQGQLCWVVGTVYMHMALKPDILEDVSNDVRYDLTPLSLPLPLASSSILTAVIAVARRTYHDNKILLG